MSASFGEVPANFQFCGALVMTALTVLTVFTLLPVYHPLARSQLTISNYQGESGKECLPPQAVLPPQVDTQSETLDNVDNEWYALDNVDNVDNA